MMKNTKARHSFKNFKMLARRASEQLIPGADEVDGSIMMEDCIMEGMEELVPMEPLLEVPTTGVSSASENGGIFSGCCFEFYSVYIFGLFTIIYLNMQCGVGIRYWNH